MIPTNALTAEGEPRFHAERDTGRLLAPEKYKPAAEWLKARRALADRTLSNCKAIGHDGLS